MAVGNKKNGGLSSVLDYWNAAYRGFVPGGLNGIPPVGHDIGPDPEPFGQDDESYVAPDSEVKIQQPIAPVPVILVEDLSHTEKRVERFIIANTANIGAVTADLIAPRNPYRTQLIVENVGPGILYLGHNESIGTSGFAMAVNTVIVLGTTREVWGLQQSGQSSIAVVSVIQEYDKDTVTS